MSSNTNGNTPKTTREMPMTWRMPDFYRPLTPNGAIRGPLRWQDETSGILPNAVKAFFQAGMPDGPPCTPTDIEIARSYAEYYINAPCWDTGGEEMTEEFARLRAGVKTVKTELELSEWLNDALNVGIDPF